MYIARPGARKDSSFYCCGFLSQVETGFAFHIPGNVTVSAEGPPKKGPLLLRAPHVHLRRAAHAAGFQPFLTKPVFETQFGIHMSMHAGMNGQKASKIQTSRKFVAAALAMSASPNSGPAVNHLRHGSQQL